MGFDVGSAEDFKNSELGLLMEIETILVKKKTHKSMKILFAEAFVSKNEEWLSLITTAAFLQHFDSACGFPGLQEWQVSFTSTC